VDRAPGRQSCQGARRSRAARFHSFGLMGCGASAPAVLLPQQPPTASYLFGTATDGEATFTMPEYEKSKPGSMLPLSRDEKTIAQLDSRSFKQSTSKFKEAEALAHLTPVKGADGKLIALIVTIPKIQPSQTQMFNFSSKIFSAVPRVDGLNSAMEHDGVALYPWATISPEMSYSSALSTKIQLATPGGFEPFATLAFTAFNNQLYSGVLKLSDGTAVAKFARAQGGTTSYTTAAGVDAGLLVAAHVASVKIVRDSDQRGGA